jgi:hypothetical protein
MRPAPPAARDWLDDLVEAARPRRSGMTSVAAAYFEEPLPATTIEDIPFENDDVVSARDYDYEREEDEDA